MVADLETSKLFLRCVQITAAQDVLRDKPKQCPNSKDPVRIEFRDQYATIELGTTLTMIELDLPSRREFYRDLIRSTQTEYELSLKDLKFPKNNSLGVHGQVIIDVILERENENKAKLQKVKDSSLRALMTTITSLPQSSVTANVVSFVMACFLVFPIEEPELDSGE